jgi:hypothetical protein
MQQSAGLSRSRINRGTSRGLEMESYVDSNLGRAERVLYRGKLWVTVAGGTGQSPLLGGG